MRRTAFRRSYGQLRFSPRPQALAGVRKLTYQASADYITGSVSGHVESEEYQGSFNAELNNGDFLNAEVTQAYEALVDAVRGRPRRHRAGRRVPLHPEQDLVLHGQPAPRQRRHHGGSRWLLRWHAVRNQLARPGRVHAAAVPRADLSYNRVAGPYGDGNSNLASSRLTYTVTPRMFVAALVQYQSRTQSVSTNVRFRWEYQLGSELFVVYSDGRTTTTRPGWLPEIENRSVVVKLTKLFRW